MVFSISLAPFSSQEVFSSQGCQIVNQLFSIYQTFIECYHFGMVKEQAVEKNGNASTLDGKTLSSCGLNFLFGSGVNGDLIPQMNGLERTNKFLRGKLSDFNGDIESAIDRLGSAVDKDECKSIFTEEMKSHLSFDEGKQSFADIKNLLENATRIVDVSENRSPEMKQINVYTLNYDSVVEKAADKIGLFCSVVVPSEAFEGRAYDHSVCYRYDWKRFVPSLVVHKIHGDSECMVLPGSEKLSIALQKSHFELLFNMKSKLMRRNEILIVIGYSGKDDDVNGIVRDAANSGLTVYWLKFMPNDIIPSDLKDLVTPVENTDGGNMSAYCSKMLSDIWKTLEL